jgi:hypothetical protein
MRKLEIVVSVSKGALPVVLAATLVPAVGLTCSATPPTQTAATSTTGESSSSGGSGGQGGMGGSGGIGGFAVSSSSAGGSAGSPSYCEPWGTQTIVVDVPPAGTPANPGQICAVAMDPVQSNNAARVTLTKSPVADNIATGLIAIDPALLADIIGSPSIAVTQAWDPQVAAMQVTNIMPAPGGFSFQAQWPLPFNVSPEQWAQMTVKTTMLLKCDPQAMTMRMVESLTYIHLCLETGELLWVSSGNMCNVCDIIAEMAPSPIVPDKHHDDLPLARAMRLRIVPLARVGASVVLLAENDGGDGLTYAWHPSGGRIEQVASDIAIWTPPSDFLPHIVQVAVSGDDAAAVATYSWREAA